MAAVMRTHQDMTPSLTPPPSDRGECDDTIMLNTETYLPEVFYPSPAPSYSAAQGIVSPRSSPNMTQQEPMYNADAQAQHLLFLDSTNTTMYPAPSTSAPNVDIYNTDYLQSYNQNPWLPYPTYPNQSSIYFHSQQDTATALGGFVDDLTTTNVIPPTPETVTSREISFDRDMQQLQQSIEPAYWPSHTQNNHKHQYPAAAGNAPGSCVSSRSPSPGLCTPASSELKGNRSSRASICSRSSSASLHTFGIPIRSPGSSTVQAWRCGYPKCTSRAVFTRGCDLRKHYNRHSKHLFCQIDGCPQSEAACITAARQHAIQTGVDVRDSSNLIITGGFSSKKDRARHEAKHNPGIKCEWQGPNGEDCGRVFSRMDNMKDHVRRIHNKGHA